jgi:hypothetical protein
MKIDKSKYLAIILPEHVKERVLKLQPPSFEVVLAHHITIQYDISKLDEDELDQWLTDSNSLVAVGYAENDRIQAIVVAVGGIIERPDGRIFHVTVSHARGAAPRDSNELLEDMSNVVKFLHPETLIQEITAELVNK